MEDDSPVLDYDSPSALRRPASVLASAAGGLTILGCPCLLMGPAHWLTSILGDRVAQVVGLVLAIGVPVTGLGFGVATVLHVRLSHGRVGGAGAGWAAIILNTLWLGFYVALWAMFPAQS